VYQFVHRKISMHMGTLPDKLHFKQPMQLMWFVFLGIDMHESTTTTMACSTTQAPPSIVTFQARLVAAFVDLAICFAVRELDRFPIM